MRINGQVVDRPSQPVQPGVAIHLTEDEASRWVGRGALKLLHALTVWDVPVTGRRCLDVGASTGGFTQVLLEHGAAQVTALDVGHGQLVPTLAQDPRVRNLPGHNIRDADPRDLGTFDLLVVDVSFISLTLVLPPLVSLARPTAHLLLLVKPQFEVGRERIGRGVVTEPGEHAAALERVLGLGTALGWQSRGLERSPVTGTHGNTEYLLWLGPASPGMMTPDGMRARIRELTTI